MKKKKFILLGLGILGTFGMTLNVNAETRENYVLDSAPSTFVTNSNDHVFANANFNTLYGNQIIDYHTSDNKKIFCIDNTLMFATNTTYTKLNGEVDSKIVYIITHAPANKDYTNFELSWITQAAIWYYQKNLNFPAGQGVNKQLMESGSTDVITSQEECNASTQCYSYRTDALWSEAKTLANAAKNADTSIVDSIQFIFDGKYTVDENNKTINTSLMSVVGLENKTIDLDISKLPNGTKLYKESGEEISKIDSSTKFYFSIPVENTKNYSIESKITLTLKDYEYYTGYKYTSGNNQPLVLVVKQTKDITGSVELKDSKVEDTASSISGSLYFVGFLILLSGAGIIYANVKPKKQTNE